MTNYMMGNRTVRLVQNHFCPVALSHIRPTSYQGRLLGALPHRFSLSTPALKSLRVKVNLDWRSARIFDKWGSIPSDTGRVSDHFVTGKVLWARLHVPIATNPPVLRRLRYRRPVYVPQNGPRPMPYSVTFPYSQNLKD